MPELPPPVEILNFEGTGESLFWRGFTVWCLPAEWKATVQKEIDSTYSHLSPEDDRAVALVGALLVESAVDDLIAAYVPGYKALAKRRDFMFSIRIELGRALKLCPGRLLHGADTIRKIRNDFAHNLTIKAFDECDRKHLASACDQLRSINPRMADGKSAREVFVNLSAMLFLGLRGYSFHVERLNQYIREAKTFRDGFMAHWTAKQDSLGCGPSPQEDSQI